jgi:putative nucleotidyltransferase-like protein
MLRPMLDIDLWVPAEGVESAVAALERSGVRSPSEERLRYPVGDPMAQQPTRVLESDGVLVEVHTRLKSLDRLASSGFSDAWETAQVVSLGGIPARVLSPDQLLTHLGLHLSRTHGFACSLLHLMDLALVADRWRDQWDWPALAREWRSQRIAIWMFLALSLARDWFDAAIPGDLERPTPEGWSAMRALAKARLWDLRRQPLPRLTRRLLQPGSVSEKLRWLQSRFVDHYWRSNGALPARVAVQEGLNRLWYDLRNRIPKYLRGWRDGSLRHEELKRGLALDRDLRDLEALVCAAGDLGFAPARLP